MKKIFLILMIGLVLSSCKDDSVSQNSSSQQAVGDGYVISNLPVGWIYVEYPTFSDGVGGAIDPPAPCAMGYYDVNDAWVGQKLTGNWSRITEYDGRFFRAEEGNAVQFIGDVDDGIPSSVQPLQTDAFQAHRHGVGQVGFGINHNEVAGGNTGIDYYRAGGNIDETSYNAIGGRTLENNDGDALDLTDYDVYHDVTGTQNATPRVDTETRPANYTMRMWRKIADNVNISDCAMLEKVSIVEYKDVSRIIKDKEGNVINTENIKREISRKAVYDADGNAEYRIIGGDKDAKMVPTKGVVITNAPDIEINIGKEEVVEVK